MTIKASEEAANKVGKLVVQVQNSAWKQNHTSKQRKVSGKPANSPWRRTSYPFEKKAKLVNILQKLGEELRVAHS